MSAAASTFYGKYRGTVVDNIDVTQCGRVRVKVPAVFGDGELNWALPCSPYAGPGVGFFAVPPVGANVWVEFEGGNPDFPIVSGGFWDVGRGPLDFAPPTTKLLKTDGVSIKLDDLPGAGGLTIEVSPPVVTTPLTLVFDVSGITLKNGVASIKLSPADVSVNDGALKVI